MKNPKIGLGDWTVADVSFLMVGVPMILCGPSVGWKMLGLIVLAMGSCAACTGWPS